jgi:hypothetical protein
MYGLTFVFSFVCNMSPPSVLDRCREGGLVKHPCRHRRLRVWSWRSGFGDIGIFRAWEQLSKVIEPVG